MAPEIGTPAGGDGGRSGCVLLDGGNTSGITPSRLALRGGQQADPLAKAREYAAAAGRNAAAGLSLGGREGLALIALAGRLADQARALARRVPA